MPEYESLVEYLEAYADDPTLAVMPIPVVADHLEKTPAAISAMIRTGKLDEVRIKKNRFVLLSSLLARQEGFEDQVETVKKYLVKQAKKGTRSLFYEPLMDQVGMKPTTPADRTKIGQILGTISERSYEENGILLSVLVHRKTAGITNPGPGFFNLAKGMGFKFKDKNDFVEEHTNLVMKAYK